MSTRSRIIATLFAVEVALFGAIVYFLGGAPTHASSVDIGGERVVDVLDAGAAPHVVVSDPDSRVILTVSSDGRVHVTDRSSLHGWMLGGPKTIAAVHVVRTTDGVRIERAKYSEHFMIFGNSSERIEIAVPVQSSIEVADSSGTEVTGLQGGMKIHSNDGHIALRDVGGPVDAQADDGYIEANSVNAPSVALRSNDGHIELHNITAHSLSAQTNDGRIEFDGTLDPNGTYNLHTADGRIRVISADTQALAIHAYTEDGAIRIDGRRVGDIGDAAKYDAAGRADGRLTIETQSGSIAINTMGVK